MFRSISLLSVFLIPSCVVAAQPEPPRHEPSPAQSESVFVKRIADFTLVDQHGKLQTLSGLAQAGPTLLVTIRSAGWCAQSKHQLLEIQKAIESFEDADLQVVALSYDSQEVLHSFALRNDIEFPLLSDPSSTAIRQLKLVNSRFPKGTLRYGVAKPAAIFIGRDRELFTALVGRRNSPAKFASTKELLNAWSNHQGKELRRKPMSMISVCGNRFVDEQGDPVSFRGIAIADPVKILDDGHWSKKHFAEMKRWGANLIRIPVHPGNFRERGSAEYLKLLKQAVEWCEQLKLYVIIDWHSIGNLHTSKFEGDIYETSIKETLAFWELISKTFRANPTVAFYELFNESTRIHLDYGECSWQQWKLMAEKMIDVIQANDPKVVCLVGGFDWSYDLQEAGEDPIKRDGVAYVAHPYPGKSPAPREDHWEKHFGFLADRCPVIVTETGFDDHGKVEHLVDGDKTFRNGILKYLDEKEISWCVWCFDPDWSPPLIRNYDYQPTISGAFFRNAMQKQGNNN